MILGGNPYGATPFGGVPIPAAFQGVVLQIGPQDVTPSLLVNSYRIRRELNGRDELEFPLVSTTGYVPLLGQQVILSIDGGLEFVGTVHEREVAFHSDGRGDYTTVQVRCVDLNELADRRLVIEVYENMTAGAIVRAIVAKYLAAELIQIGDVQDGPTVARVVFPYQSAASCFDDLSEQSGFHWHIDAQRGMNFAARETAPAPFTITSANAVFRGLRGTRTRNQYRNVQYMDGGRGVTDPRTESFRGNGLQQSWNVEFEIFAKPTIDVNFQPQTVGIRGVDTTTQFYWNKGETAIGRLSSLPPLLATDIIHVTYQGLFDVIEIVEDTAAILERQQVQGGTGRYEQLDRDDQLDGQDRVLEKGISLLRRYASLDEVIEFETDVVGLTIGQLATVDVPELGLSGTFLITQLEIAPLNVTQRRFTVTATTGELKGRWQDLFANLLASNRPIVLREGEILQEVLAVHDPVGVTDSVVATLDNAATGEWGTGEAGTAEFGG